jgi:ABC-type Na+ efflux pump permease subunit
VKEQQEDEHRHDQRRKRDKLMEFVRVFWPIGIAVLMLVTTWAELRVKVASLDERVKSAESSEKQIQEHTTAIAVLNANVSAIRDNVEDVKKNTERIINRLDRAASRDR